MRPLVPAHVKPGVCTCVGHGGDGFPSARDIATEIRHHERARAVLYSNSRGRAFTVNKM